jgi:outer membrane protein TolC
MTIHYRILTVVVLIISETAVGKVYRLDQLIDEALRNSVEIQSVTREIDQAESKIQVLFAGMFPTITATMDVSHTFAYFLPFIFTGSSDATSSGVLSGEQPAGRYAAATGSSVNGVFFNPSSATQPAPSLGNLFTIPPNTIAGALTLRQPLFLQGKTVSNFKIARARQRMLLCKYEESRNRVKAETIKFFYRVLLEQKRLGISKEQFHLASEAHRLVIVNFSMGRARELDTLNSFLQREQARIDEKKAESNRRTAAEAIITHCGTAQVPADFWVTGEFPEPVFYISVDEAIVQLHRGNNRIIQLKGSEIITNQQVKLARAEYLPVVAAGAVLGKIGQFSKLDDPGPVTWGNDQKVFVGLSWTLFSGFTRKHIVHQRLAERDMVLLAQQRTIDSLELTTRTSFERTMMDKEQLSALQTMVDIARKSHLLARTAYEAGSGTLFDLQNARLELNKKKLAFSEALYVFHISVTDFKLLIGLL